MTDPGDLSTTDSNTPTTELPEASPENINPGLGGEGKLKNTEDNNKDQARISSSNPDPLSL